MKIENLEIFRAGDYGEKGRWTAAHLAQIAASYDPSFHEAPVTVDHQQAGPALGWVKRLIARGERLIAELEIASKDFYTQMQEGKWKKRSAEIYPDLGGKGPYLRAVSFLGAMVPEVKGLADARFAEGDAVAEKIYIEFDEKKNGRDGGGDPDDGGDGEMSKTLKEVLSGKTPEEVAAFFAEGLDDSLLGVATFSEWLKQKQHSAAVKALADAGLDENGQTREQVPATTNMSPEVKAMFAEEQQKRQASEARVLELEKRDFERDLDVKFSEQMRQGKLTPAIAKPLKKLASVLKFSAAGEQTVTFSEKDKDGKVTTTEKAASALIDDVLAAMPQIVKMGEVKYNELPDTSPDGGRTTQDGTPITGEDRVAVVEKFMEDQAKAGKTLTFGEAAELLAAQGKLR